MASTLIFYDSFKEAIADGRIDLDTDTFKLMLTTSTYVPNVGTHTVKTDVTNEISNGGYTAGGQALGSVTWGQVAGTATFDAANVTWTASGTSLVAHYAVLYSDNTGKDLICYITLDATPADITVVVGNSLTVQWNGSGIFKLE
jgi:hypothetical protein